MTTDITELAQSEINDALAQLKQFSEYPMPSTQYARVLRKYITSQAEALEKAKHKAAVDREAAASLNVENQELTRRVAELESRTVTVKQYDEFQVCHYGATEDYAKGYIDCQNNFSKWLTAAGIKWEAE